MPKPTKLRVDTEELLKTEKRVLSLLNDITSHYEAIDQRFNELFGYWGGDKRNAFELEMQQAHEDKDARITAFQTFYQEALMEVPYAYIRLEDEISSMVKKALSDN